MNDKTLINFFKKVIKPYKKNIAIIFILSIISTSIIASVPLILNETLNSFLDEDNIDYLILLIILGVLLIQLVVTFLHDFFVSYTGEKIAIEYRKELFHKLLFNEKADLKRSHIASRINDDINALKKSLTDYLLDSIKNSLLLIIMLILLAYINIWISLILLGTLTIIAIVGIISLNKIRDLADKIQNLHTNLMAYVSENLNNFIMIKTFTLENYIFNKYTKENRKLLKLVKKQNIKLSSIKPITNFTMYILAIIAFLLLFYFFSGMARSSIISYLFYSFVLAASISQLSTALSNFKKESGTIYQLAKFEQQLFSFDGSYPMNFTSGPEIEFNEVSFKYDQKYIIKNANFHIKPNKINAIIGESGNGKSTLINLILRQLTPESGEIYINGFPLSDIEIKSYFQNVGVAFQHPFLLNESVYENIRIGNLDGNESNIKTIVDRLNINSSFNVNSQVGEGSEKISRGQAQRVALARVFYKNPSLIILDEATASLDKKNESFIKQELLDKKEKATIIIISHDESFIRNYIDHYLFIDEEKVVEYDSVTNKNNGVFYN